MNQIFLTVLVAVVSYLLGCFSTGITISRLQGVDIRKHGSKNTGASNVLRVLGLKSGILTFIGDIIKASIAVWLGYFVLGNAFGRSITALRAARAWPAPLRSFSLWMYCALCLPLPSVWLSSPSPNTSALAA